LGLPISAYLKIIVGEVGKYRKAKYFSIFCNKITFFASLKTNNLSRLESRRRKSKYVNSWLEHFFI